jgi:hypothetical protein
MPRQARRLEQVEGLVRQALVDLGMQDPPDALLYDSNDVITAMNMAWPDGTAGIYTVTSQASDGAVTGFTATYVGATTKTVSVTIPRDAGSHISGAMTVSVA